ncbi:MAG: alpha/beta hydrolase [Leptolyngbya sp. SIO1E4]|nr:alpha/beta hydrolase [Leptolyngbya sp. SIO1E4]
MFYNAENRKINIEGTDMDYVVFGSGQKPFVILPGLSDGLKTVKGEATKLAIYYQKFAKDFRIYMFSRKNQIEKGYGTKDMARDQKIALETLGIQHADVMGVSQGGMIAQHLAIDYPDFVKKLVIGVSVSRQNQTIQNVVKSWMKMAELNDYKTLVIDTMEKTFTEERLKIYRFLYPIISRLNRPKSFDRFLIQADACLHHNSYNELDKIQCPTLVIGGDSDHVVGKNTSEEMAAKIKDSKLIVYEGLGHGAYEETKDFNQQVKAFLADNR